MDDCYPQPETGLRAFFKSTSVTTSGLVHASDEYCTGIFVVSGYQRRSGTGGQGANGTGTVWYMTTWDDSRNVALFYRMDGTGGQTTWEHLHTTASTADNAGSRYQTSFAHFVQEDGTDYVIVALRSSIDRGLFAWRYDASQANSDGGSDGVITRIQNYDGVLGISQARIIVGSHESPDADTLYWSDAGSIAFTGGTSGSVIPSPSFPRNAITFLGTFDPDQLLLGFSGAPWMTITGDINSATTPIRQMGDGHYPEGLQDSIRTPDGLVFITQHGPAYLTDGRSFTDLTPMLPGFNAAQPNGNFLGFGTGEFHEGFLFLPTGIVRFEETKGWFHVSDQDGYYIFADPTEGVVTVSRGTSFTIRQRNVARSTGSRASSYTWRSAPFAQPDGTQTEVREVVIQGEVYSASTYTLTLTDHLGNTQTLATATLPTGKHAISVPTLLRGDYVDLKIVSANNGSGEAPTIERVRLGFGAGHSL